MKIKYFSGEVDVKNSEELGDYLVDDLGYANDPVVQAYADLLFKIHEKIESLEKHEPQLKQGLGTIESLGQLKALKSLLENK